MKSRAENAASPGRTKKSQRTRDDILRAAAELFCKYGYEGASLEMIASAVDLRQGSLYYYFRTKEALADEVLSIGLAASMAAVRDAVSTLPPDAGFVDRLNAAVKAHLDRVLGDDDFSRANIRIFHQIPSGAHARQLAARDRYARWWLTLLQQGVSEGVLRPEINAHIARMLLIGAMNWSIDWFNPARGNIEAIARELVTTFLRGWGAAGTA